MPFIPVPQCIEVRLNGVIAGSEAMVNVLHFFNVGDDTLYADGALELATQIATGFSSYLASEIAASAGIVDIAVRDISEPDKPSFVNTVDAYGARTDHVLPPQIALVATLRSDVGGRGGRGRMFVGGWTEYNNENPGKATAGAADAVENFISSIQNLAVPQADPGQDLVLQLAVASRHAHVGGNAGGAPIAPIAHPVTAWSVNRKWDTMRSRGRSLVLGI